MNIILSRVSNRFMHVNNNPGIDKNFVPITRGGTSGSASPKPEGEVAAASVDAEATTPAKEGVGRAFCEIQ